LDPIFIFAFNRLTTLLPSSLPFYLTNVQRVSGREVDGAILPASHVLGAFILIDPLPKAWHHGKIRAGNDIQFLQMGLET
jgi:hypothetical protein